MRPFCAAIDWGTTNFRIWLLNAEGQEITKTESGEGMIHCVEAGFSTVLENHLFAMDAPSDLPVIVCGMAGSQQGWVEAGYLDTPAALSDIAENSVPAPGGSQRLVHILPGIAQRGPQAPDVMRGEETQLLGAVGSHSPSMLVCIPGTHSKWIELDKGQVIRFTTFMTGELYSVISRQTILRHAVEGNEFNQEAFSSAVLRSLNDPAHLTASLFTIRAGQLLEPDANKAGAACLSGFLIGSEVAAAVSQYDTSQPVHLIASGQMADLYTEALDLAGFSTTLADAEKASQNGLWLAANQLFKPQQEIT